MRYSVHELRCFHFFKFFFLNVVNSICVCVCITWPWPLPKRPCVSLAVTKCGPCRFTSSHSRTSCLMAGRGHQAPPPFSTRTLKRAMEHSLLIGSRWRHFERPQTRVVDSVEKSNTTEPVPLSDFWLVGFFFNTWNLKKNENWNCSERNPSWRHCQYVGHLRWQAKKILKMNLSRSSCIQSKKKGLIE